MKELEIRRTEVNTFFKPVNDTAAIEQLNKELSADGGRTAIISGCIDTQKVHISSAVAQNYKFMLVITSDEAKARNMCDDAAFLMEKRCIIRQRMRYFTVQMLRETR